MLPCASARGASSVARNPAGDRRRQTRLDRGWKPAVGTERRKLLFLPSPAGNRLAVRGQPRQVNLADGVQPRPRRPNAVGRLGRPHRARHDLAVHDQGHRPHLDPRQGARQRVAAREGRRHAPDEAGERRVVEQVQRQHARPRGCRPPGDRGGGVRRRRELPEVDGDEAPPQRDGVGGAVGRPGAMAAAAGATSRNRPAGWPADSAAASPASSAAASAVEPRNAPAWPDTRRKAPSTTARNNPPESMPTKSSRHRHSPDAAARPTDHSKRHAICG